MESSANPSATNNEQKQDEIKSITLKGHKGSVLCLAHSSSSIIPPKSNLKKTKTSPSSDTQVKHQNQPSFVSDVLLLSGSEDGTARLWDLRSGIRAVKCVLAPQKDHVTSVAFYPSSVEPSFNALKYENDDDTVTNKNNFSQNYTIYISCSSKVYGYDIRNTCTPIIREYNHDLSPFLQNQDEINQLSFIFAKHGNAPSSTSPCYISAADDYGQIRIMNVNDNKTFEFTNPENTSNSKSTSTHESSSTASPMMKILQHAKSNNPAIVTNAIFQPKNRHVFHSNLQNQNLILASAGTDCTVHLWDASSRYAHIKPSLSYIIPQDDTSSQVQLCNPPFVHSLSFSHSGSILAAGLGDGTCMMFRLSDQQQQQKQDGNNESKPKSKSKKNSKFASSSKQKKSKKKQNKLILRPCLRLRDGHEGSVACVHFPQFYLGSVNDSIYHDINQNNENDDGGNSSGVHHLERDDRLFCSAGNEGSILFWDLGTDMAGTFAIDPSAMFHGTRSLSSSSTKSSICTTPSKILFGISHGQKPNWLVSSSKIQSGVLPSTLFVADTTNDITAYMMDMV